MLVYFRFVVFIRKKYSMFSNVLSKFRTAFLIIINIVINASDDPSISQIPHFLVDQINGADQLAKIG